jgi:hypothetical protein
MQITVQLAGNRGVVPGMKEELSMTKTWNLIQETVRSTKHPFRQTESRPPKKKNRYERRKIRELLRLGDWVSEVEA